MLYNECASVSLESLTHWIFWKRHQNISIPKCRCCSFLQIQITCIDCLVSFSANSPAFALCYSISSSSSGEIQSGTQWSSAWLLTLILWMVSLRSMSSRNHGCNSKSSLVMRSSGSRRNRERMMQRALDERQSGNTKEPRAILANKEACSESLKG